MGCIIVIFTLLVLGAATLVEAWVLSLLWNWAMPAIFTGCPEISFLQMLAIMIILNIIGGCFRTVVKK